jgi:CRP-like cAMP-binding protein
MTQLEILRNALFEFAQLGKEDFNISIPFWKTKEFKKGDFYNACGCVCNYLGFTTEGYFRAYLMNEEGIEKNIFLYLPHQIVVAYKSFIHEIPCNYYTQAITESQAICIDHKDLQSLYLKSHGWERFGRLVAERAFDIANDRAESFFFKSAEERYMDLIRLQPDIVEHIPLYHISSYLGIAGPSLSRIRRRILRKRYDFNRG